jgi:hypothetical protein
VKDNSEEALVELIAGFTHDPLSFVLAAFPWGEPGTALEKESGPRQWQVELLRYVGEQVSAGVEANTAIQAAIASGHGIGKSAAVSFMILWTISTCQNTRGVITANTETQLRTKTWPELRKWHALAINKHWFTCAATSIHANGDLEKTWRIDAIPWSDNNTEAFAGLHNKGSRVIVVFDEASAVADKIWEVTEGAMTDEGTEIIWCAFGNPTRNTGRFRECFGRLSHRWWNRQIDSRTVPGTNKSQIDKWIQDYGEDSDFVRVRVRGQFPRAGSMQFISSDLVSDAVKRKDVASTIYDPLVIGVDVARFGDDESVICFRRGRDARSIPWLSFRGMDTMTLAGRVVMEAMQHHADAIFIDETGVGGGVIDRCRQLGLNVIGVNNGAKSDLPVEGELVANKGAECWARMRQWLPQGMIPANDLALGQQLEGREYGFNAHNEIVLERKDDMKKRGLSSPDRADGLALTFAQLVAPRQRPVELGPRNDNRGDFDPYR